MDTQQQGKLIVVEGLDRAGKSTQAARLAARLRSELGQDIVEMKFPDRTTAIGEMINKYLTTKETELSDEAIHLLFSANRWEAAPRMLSLLAAGKSLLVDRYVYSGVAFSSAKGLDFEWCRSPDIGLPKPDLVVFLDIDAQAAAARGGYGAERYETTEMQRNVRKMFVKLSEPQWAWIDAGRSLDEVENDIWAAAAPLYASPK